MGTKAFLILCLGFILLVAGCENPAAPNFSTDHQIQSPLVLNKTYTFLGGSESLIDTTSSQFDSLFSVAGNGLVSLSKTTPFDFGSLDNALPTISANTINSHSEIGPITIDNFSSQGASGNIGSATFQNITGQNSSGYPAGTALAAGSTPGTVNIVLNTDYFKSAIIKQNGQLVLSFKNDLGFDISTLTITLKAGTTTIQNATISSFSDNTTAQATFTIAAGTSLHDLNIDVSASWNSQNMKRNPSDLVAQDATGNQLTASQVTAAVSSQDFTSTGTTDIDSTDFKFSSSTHYIQLGTGSLDVNNIVNNIDMNVDTLLISFPGIRKSPFNPADSLVVEFSGTDKIPSSSTNAVTKNVDLSGYRIYALNNHLPYNIHGVTENGQQGAGSSLKTIHDTDSLTATIDISKMTVKKAFGIINPKTVLLNTDDPSNGTNILDLNDTTESKSVDLGGLGKLSKQINGLKFIKPVMDLLYNTNLGTEATIFAAMRGKSANGNTVYLHGVSGSPYEVSSSETTSELVENGKPLSADQLFKFNIKKSPDGSIITSDVKFDTTDSNIRAFFNNLPTDIRFIGIAKLNYGGAKEGLIVDPVQFNPTVDVNVPLKFKTQLSSYSDTTSANLSSLPGKNNNKEQLTDAKLTIDYVNKLPLRLQLSFVMLNSQTGEVTQIPEVGQASEVIAAASVDPNTKFVTQANKGEMVFTLNKDQLNVLNQTRKMIIGIDFNTTNKDVVNIKDTDSITLSIKMSVNIKSTID